MNNLSGAAIERAVAIKERIARLEKKLMGLLGGPDTAPVGKAAKPRRKMSAAGRARIAAAAKARRAKVKASKK